MTATNLKRFILAATLIACTVTAAKSVFGAESNRWFQIEVSIFSNESQIDRNEEDWRASELDLSFPALMRRLNLLDSLLLLKSLDESASLIDANPLESGAINPPLLTPAQERLQATGPQPLRETGNFRFYDFDRDTYVQLPTAQSDFQGTNRALERTSANRLLYHGLWRQPVLGENNATSLLVEGGLDYNGRHELEGSVTIRFNDNADRVVIDANLWLTEFTAVERDSTDWQLPALPEQLTSDDSTPQTAVAGPIYFINRIYQMRQSRDMRSNEFHYLDHPALGLVVIVRPYNPPRRTQR